MRRRLFVVLPTVLVIALPAAAQTVDDVIARNLEAMGGVQKLKAVQSVRMTGRLADSWTEAAFTLEMKRPNMTRMDITRQARSYLVIKEETKVPSPFLLRGDEIEVETTFGDYKNVGGLTFAHRIDSGPKGDPEGRSKRIIKKIELNVPIDDARFRIPQ